MWPVTITMDGAAKDQWRSKRLLINHNMSYNECYLGPYSN